jgi:toxin ParE1/3/4
MTKRRTPRYAILKDASQDLVDIRRLTVKNWGKAQSTEYIRELKEVFALLALNPDIGSSRDNDLGGGIRSFAHKSHVTYYQKTGPDIAIIGVFHHSAIPDSHLRGQGHDREKPASEASMKESGTPK